MSGCLGSGLLLSFVMSEALYRRRGRLVENDGEREKSDGELVAGTSSNFAPTSLENYCATSETS